jgi:hypothetical protein
MSTFLAPIFLLSKPSIASSTFSKPKSLEKFLKVEKSECYFIPTKNYPKK